MKTIVKQDTVHPKYPCTEPTMIIAVEDSDYYDRPYGVTADDMIESILNTKEFFKYTLYADAVYVCQKLDNCLSFEYIKNYLLKRFNYEQYEQN